MTCSKTRNDWLKDIKQACALAGARLHFNSLMLRYTASFLFHIRIWTPKPRVSNEALKRAQRRMGRVYRKMCDGNMAQSDGPAKRSPWPLPLDSAINRTKSLNLLNFAFLINKMYLKIIPSSDLAEDKKK